MIYNTETEQSTVTSYHLDESHEHKVECKSTYYKFSLQHNTYYMIASI